jgi:hypothetical protein
MYVVSIHHEMHTTVHILRKLPHARCCCETAVDNNQGFQLGAIAVKCTPKEHTFGNLKVKGGLGGPNHQLS